MSNTFTLKSNSTITFGTNGFKIEYPPQKSFEIAKYVRVLYDNIVSVSNIFDILTHYLIVVECCTMEEPYKIIELRIKTITNKDAYEIRKILWSKCVITSSKKDNLLGI